MFSGVSISNVCCDKIFCVIMHLLAHVAEIVCDLLESKSTFYTNQEECLNFKYLKNVEMSICNDKKIIIINK